jgi:hypothetical protein
MRQQVADYFVKTAGSAGLKRLERIARSRMEKAVRKGEDIDPFQFATPKQLYKSTSSMMRKTVGFKPGTYNDAGLRAGLSWAAKARKG